MKDFPKNYSRELFRFIWSAPVRGYQLIEAKRVHPGAPFPKKHKFPVQEFLKIYSGKHSYRQYHPLNDHPQLFLEFNRLQPTRENVLAFANQYGRLGSEPILLDDNKNGTPIWGEPIKLWEQEIFEMKMLEKIYRLVENEEKERLRNLFKWTIQSRGRSTIHFECSPTFIRYETVPFRINIAASDLHPEVFKRLPVGSVIDAAKLLIARRINKKLEDQISPVLLLDPNGKVESYISPKNLLGALWFQFSQLISGERKYRTCAFCEEWMDVTDNKKNKRVHDRCSRRVKQAKWRQGAKDKGSGSV